jgi:hypothetical protein
MKPNELTFGLFYFCCLGWGPVGGDGRKGEDALMTLLLWREMTASANPSAEIAHLNYDICRYPALSLRPLCSAT